ncbi:LEAF RUST 10 DISEASE-RESISTANCE LOCUS RECEPTOR-LIKE PROTEIN KINASE-like 2.4 [Cajanus cajan]|uniref:LEAF RUST 10 DISEASE-RESISTANCE LOCUS RECEPTOR-LIKE PROTEIN KINASE-like 2.4 n=1 Tax=Cajanus cajan TaxID=3821 RepID=UPI0010FB215B|nr:LEAF RUST 10 DISEASE-RESISTANCE LOCUS RECEPTOR-LIKE PROTEIN KINASE-like 2.4 [Cajanus cajan]
MRCSCARLRTYTVLIVNPVVVERVHYLFLKITGNLVWLQLICSVSSCSLTLYSFTLLVMEMGTKIVHSFTCGRLGTFYYPFTKAEQPHCGLLPIHDCDNPHSPIITIQLEKNGKNLELNGVVQQNAITILDEDFHRSLQQNTCRTLNNNYSLPSPSPLYSIYIKYNVTLFRCKQGLKINQPPKHYLKYPCHGYEYDIYYDSLPSPNNEEAHNLFSSCSVFLLPSKDETNTKDILSFVTAEMVLEVVLSNDCDECYNHRGGQCRLDNNQKFYCDTGKTGKKLLVVGLVAAASVLVIAGVVVLVVVMACFRRKIFLRENPTHRIIEGFLKEHGPLPTSRYNYSEVKKMTDSFRNKLGQGGFGTVYKGKKLHDGRVVAVKILNKSDGNGEEFINEVASISRTSHVNIVRLLGFCLDGSKRALIYEFMPNGSLDKFIYEEKSPPQVAHQLHCKILYDIAIGIARGLEYLHRGCNTRILHFDIKPHNILLDEDFCPKISDFGLAILLEKESAVSIFGARGTAGYIAPEVFSRNFGVVSHKSDVYSYGMMILEMVGMKNNIKAEVNRSSEIYFPHWIYNRLESDQELGLQNIRNKSDDNTVRKMTIVGLWCIQTYPSTRPAISKVVEMLESKVELLQIPPKPCLSPVHLSCETL